MELSIILPTYKEKENLEILIPEIENEFQNTAHEIIVVDDGSRDGTRELIAEFNAKYQNIFLQERAGLLGIGSALRDGYNKAQGEIIVSSDADCSFSAGDMRRIFEKTQAGYDMVLGYKVTDTPHDSTTRSKYNIRGWVENFIISPASNMIIGLLTGIGLKNYNTDFRAIKNSTWKKIHTKEDKMFFLLETIVRARQSGAKITEIPVTFSARKAGESKVHFLKQAPQYLYKLIRLVFLEK